MNTIAKAVASTAIFLTFAARPVVAQGVDPAVEQDIVKLIEASGAGNMLEQLATNMMAQMTDAMAQGRPNVPPRAFEIARDVMTERVVAGVRGPDGLLAQIVPIYAKHFTHDDIKALLAFYDSDVGRKIVAAQPALTAEGAKAGQAWAAAIMPGVQAEILERFKVEGLVR